MALSSRLPLDDPWSGVRLLTPDLGVFVISLVTLVVCNRLVKKRDDFTFQSVASDSTQGVSGYLLYRHRLGLTAMLLLIWVICGTCALTHIYHASARLSTPETLNAVLNLSQTGSVSNEALHISVSGVFYLALS